MSMRILLLNPNTSVEMTEHIGREAARYGLPDTRLELATARFGADVIASRASYAIAAHAVLDAFADYRKGAGARAHHGGDVDGVIIACFGDPGLEALRELIAVPVVGLLESAVAKAASAVGPFGVVTAGPAWIPMLNERIAQGPHAALSRGVFAIDTTGLAVTRDPDRFVDQLQTAVDAASQAGAGAVILGGSALAGFGPRLRTQAVLIDPLESAMGMVQGVFDAVVASDAHRAYPPSVQWRGLSPALDALLVQTGGR